MVHVQTPNWITISVPNVFLLAVCFETEGGPRGRTAPKNHSLVSAKEEIGRHLFWQSMKTHQSRIYHESTKKCLLKILLIDLSLNFVLLPSFRGIQVLSAMYYKPSNVSCCFRRRTGILSQPVLNVSLITVSHSFP